MPEHVVGGRLSHGLAWFTTTFRWAIVLAWAAGAVAATIYLPSLSEQEGDALGGLVAEDSAAVAARTRSAELFPVPILAETAIVQRDPNGLSEAAQRRVFERAAALAGSGGPPEGVAFALPVTNTERIFPGSRESSTTAVTYLFFPLGTSLDDQQRAAEELAAQEVSRPDDHLVGITGPAPARLEEMRTVQDSVTTVEIATVALIAVVLALTFRSPGAPLVALVSAGVAYLVTIRVLPAVGDVSGAQMPGEIEPLVVVLLLGIVTDYAIFFLSGVRGRLLAGDRRLDAGRRATAENVPIVLTAGLIVAAGALTLLAGQLGYLRALGPGMAVTALMGLVASITLVPALLAIAGRAAFWPGRARSVPAQEEDTAGARPPARRRPARLRERVALAATARPVAAVIAVVSIAALVAAASGLREAKLGFTLITGLPGDSDVRAAEEAAAAGFAAGIVAPTEILVEEPGLANEREAVVRLQELVAGQEGVAGVLGPRDAPEDVAENVVFSEDGGAARLAVILEHEPLGGDAIAALRDLDDAMPRLLDEAGLAGASVAFAGDTALAEETVSQIVGDMGRIALAALGINLLLLVVFLRSLVAPLFLLATSVLALGATLGLTTYLFQGALGYEELTYYVPFAAAVLLVSLGSDYNVFVVGRVWEEARRRPLREAIATAVPRASKTIAAAGLALAGSFALLTLVPLRSFRELGFALALGVLVESFLVRSLLVPSLISLFGDASWWPGRRRIVRRREGRLESGGATAD